MRTTSGRRVCRPTETVSWLTSGQSLLAGALKSMSRACDPALEASVRRCVGRPDLDETIVWFRVRQR